MTLNGVADAPVWTFEFGFGDGSDRGAGRAITGRAKAILLGRNTYEMFEPAWSTRTVEDDPGAPFFNDTIKYVVSSTRDNPTWSNSEFIGAYDADRIRRLKDEVDGDIFVSGSTTLVRALLADGLVDGLHLFVLPAHPQRGRAPLRRPRPQVRARRDAPVRQRRRSYLGYRAVTVK